MPGDHQIGDMSRRRLMIEPSREAAGLVDRVGRMALPLEGPADLDPLLERIGERALCPAGRGLARHLGILPLAGRISQRLIREKGFSFIAVEGDWPDCYRVNRYVKGRPDSGADAGEVLQAFDRWPTWMWANEEVVELAEWLRGHNDGQAEDRKVGFFGLDVYSLWESLYAVLGYLRKADPSALPAARQAFRCFEPYGEDAQEYARATADGADLLRGRGHRLARGTAPPRPRYREDGREEYFAAEQNALVVKDAEAYYRAMVRGGPESWNIRDRHMTETLERLMRTTGRRQGHRLGAQHPHRRRALHRHGRRRHGERRPTGARAARRRGGRPGRVRLLPRQRDRRRRVGGPDGDRWRPAGPRGELGGHPPPRRRGGQVAAARRRPRRRGLPRGARAIARSAWSTTPSASDSAITCRPSSPAATTPSAISTRPAPCTRCTSARTWRRCPRRIPRACRGRRGEWRADPSSSRGDPDQHCRRSTARRIASTDSPANRGWVWWRYPSPRRASHPLGREKDDRSYQTESSAGSHSTRNRSSPATTCPGRVA